MEDRWDVLVVGGGPAGAIASYLLKQRYSRRVLLLEKETFPRLKPCAGGIAPRTELLLRALNLWSGVEPHRYLITSAELVTPNGTSINLRGGRFLTTFSPILLRSVALFSRIPVVGRLIPRMMTKMKA